MRVVMRRTGLSADLLRVWEKRHGVVQPTRSPSGRRLYSDADVERLRLLYRATLAGRGIGQVARLSTPELAELVRRDAGAAERGEAPIAPAAVAPAPAGFLDESMTAIARLDAAALDAVLRRAIVALSADAFLDALVAELVRRVDERRRAGELRPVHGHLARIMIRRVLERLLEAAAAPGTARHALAATPPGETNELGALLAAATAAAEGWRVTYLGAGLSAEDLAEAARHTRAEVVLLGVVRPSPSSAAARELRRLGALLPPDTALLVCGAAPAAAPDDIGATRLDDLGALRWWLRARAPVVTPA
jgi:DNA-binding transcriptional MerR regulator